MEVENRAPAAAVELSDCDLSEQIKAVTKDSHVRAENTELMLSYQRGQVTMAQYKLLLCSLHEIYQALEEALDTNSNHPSVAPIYFPAELARLESVEKDLEHFYGQDWREKIVIPAATKRYASRLRQIGKENPEFLVAHSYTRYLGDLSGGQILGRITQKSLGLKNGDGLSFFSFPGVSSANLFKQLYRSRMNSIELTEEERNGVLEEAVKAFEFNIQVFDDLQKMLSVTQKDSQSHTTQSKLANDTDMEAEKRAPAAPEQLRDCDLSEQIKAVTKDSHVRAENTELMLSYQRGQVTMEQYKLLLCSLYEIYQALEEALDSNSNHPSVAPIYFPAELARLESVEKDLEHFYGQDWREKIVIPAATKRYAHRLRQIGKENPEFLVAHSYTRYLGDLSGGQILGRITQKSLGLKNGDGLSFFSFPGVSSANLFKQLYRSRMNSIELTEEERNGVLEEAVRAFEFNIQVFDDVQMLSVTQNVSQSHTTQSKLANGDQMMAKTLQMPIIMMKASHVFRLAVGLFLALATVSMGMYAL